MLSPSARAALDELQARDDPSILGLVLSGSVARGMATERSDVDVYVVWDDDVERETSRSAAIDEIYWSVTDLEQVDRYGTGGWYFRWSFAHAQVLRDLTGGRIKEAVRRQAAVDDDEQRWVLVDQDRLDGYVNFAYRALKNHRDGRLLEAQLDASESVPWLLDVMFTLAGRLRPYNKYLSWELREHPLAVPEWSAEAFLPELERILTGDPEAIRRTFAVVDREVRVWDVAHNTTVCGDDIDSWGDELALFWVDSSQASGPLWVDPNGRRHEPTSRSGHVSRRGALCDSYFACGWALAHGASPARHDDGPRVSHCLWVLPARTWGPR